MANIKIEKAIVKSVSATEEVSTSFKKRNLIITIDNETDYPQVIKIEAVNGKCDDQNLNEVRPGDTITVHASLRGREWTNPKTNATEVFNTIQYWKIDINQTVADNGAPASSAPAYIPPADLNSAPGEDDDLPFG